MTLRSRQQEPTADHLAREIDRLPYVAATVSLPDIHMKAGMEAPSSFVVATRGKIVPHLVSESINDGMGLLVFDVDVETIPSSQLVQILETINGFGAQTKLAPSKHSWSREVLEEACRGGAEPLLRHYGLPDSYLDAIEDRGRSGPDWLPSDLFRQAVPRYLRRTRLTRSEIGLNFGGNHFLEIQVVDEIHDQEKARTLGVAQGKLAIMYHLGPGPLGSILSNLYAFRQKPPIHRKVGYAVFRQILHASRGWDAYRQFGGLRSWMAVEADSPQGRAISNVLDIIKNYGFAYRMGTVRAITDAVNEVLGLRDSDANLVTDLSHNMIQPETIDGEEFWVSRHNCCRPVPGMAGIVAGNHQASSCLTVSPPEAAERIGGFDHGVGYLLDEASRTRMATPDPRDHETTRIVMQRGFEGIHRLDRQPLLDRTVLDAAMATLSAQGFAQPVAFLRPLMTLKHRT